MNAEEQAREIAELHHENAILTAKLELAQDKNARLNELLKTQADHLVELNEMIDNLRRNQVTEELAAWIVTMKSTGGGSQLSKEHLDMIERLAR
jgi:wobble nucleotide-excising tRNase